MDQRQALSAFAALAQETRLQIVRMLVVAGPDGMAAGMVAEKTAVSPSNYLLPSEGARTIRPHQPEARIPLDHLHRQLRMRWAVCIRFLMEDCCAGNPEICAPVAAVVACCAPKVEEKLQ